MKTPTKIPTEAELFNGWDNAPASYSGAEGIIRYTLEKMAPFIHEPEPPHWRLLEVGEKVEPGDEYFDLRFYTWEICSGKYMEVRSSIPHRRRVGTPADPEREAFEKWHQEVTKLGPLEHNKETLWLGWQAARKAQQP